MHSLDLFILIIASTGNLLIGLLSFIKNSKNLTHKLFFLLTITLVGWTTANYISLTTDSAELLFVAIKTILVFVILQNSLFFLFVSAFPGNKLRLNYNNKIAYLIFSLATVFLGIWPSFFASYTTSEASISPRPSIFIGLFVVHTAFSIIVGITMLIIRYMQSAGLIRRQYQFLLFASSVLLLIAPVTNFILPLVFDIKVFIPLAPLYTIAFAGLISYSMVKHRLLDFRTLVAKAFVYILTIAVVAFVYSGLAFGIVTIVLKDTDLSLYQLATYVALAVVLAFSFPQIKRFFDHVTNRFFYKDSYSTQSFLNELNKVLVTTMELESLLKQSKRVIETNLKPSYCTFLVRKPSGLDFTEVGSHKWLESINIDDFEKLFQHHPSKIISADELGQDYTQIKSVMDYINAAIIVTFTAHNVRRDKIGYLVLGYKKSGNLYDEKDIANLGIISNELVIAMQNALRFEEIENFNITLQEKINDATRRLRQTNEKLKNLDETKDDFISMASHQLRTPLTSVKGYLSMVLEGDAGKLTAMQKKLLSQAFISSQRMVFLIADLLNVSRLKTGKFVIETKPTNLKDIVKEEIDQLNETASSRDLELIYKGPAKFPMLMLDETKIRQVIMNFIDNAIYYTPAGGRIEVVLSETETSVVLKITDNGIGVPKDEQHHLFNKFYRAGNARKARPDGTGLGLFMAKKVIVAQGGAIIFSSHEGKGSTFGFSFPKERLLVPVTGS